VGAASYELDQFLSGGYYLATPAKRHPSFSALLPETILTVSPCIADVGPNGDNWASTTLEEQEAEASTIGVSPADLPAYLDSFDAITRRTVLPAGMRAAAEPFEVMPFGLSSFAIASELHAQINPLALLLGIGLHASLAPLLYEQRDRDINRGFGLIDRIEQNQRLSPGRILGFEPLGFHAMSFHSWICNYFPDKVSTDLGIQPAANGFIAEFSDAVRATAYIAKAKGEPAIWLPWLVVQYGQMI